MITTADTKTDIPTIDTDGLFDEMCEKACESIAIGEGIVATRGRVTPDGPVARDVTGPVLKTREVEVRVPIWRGGASSVEGGYGVRFFNPTARIEGDSLVVNYEVMTD